MLGSTSCNDSADDYKNKCGTNKEKKFDLNRAKL